MKKRVLIVGHDGALCEMLARFIRELREDALIEEIQEPSEAYRYAMEHTVELFIVCSLLERQKRTDAVGFRFIWTMRQCRRYTFTPVIIISNVEDPTNYAFRELHCFDYIERPFGEQRLKRVIETALLFRSEENPERYLYIRRNRVIYPLDCMSILYAQVDNKIMYLKTLEGKVHKAPYLTCKQLLEEADAPYLFQCARGTVINVRYIETIDITNRFVLMKNGHALDIGGCFVKRIKELAAGHSRI